MDACLTGVLAGYGIAIPVGAIAILIVQVGIKCGFRCALAAGAGAATADFVYAGLAVVGGASLAGAVDSGSDWLRIPSALVLVAIALVGLRRANQTQTQQQTELPNRNELAATYARFVGLTVINPTTVVYFAAVVVGLGVAADLTPSEGALFAVGAFLASFSWQALLAAVGGLSRHRLSARIQRLAVIGGNLLILGLAAWMLLG